MLSALLFVHILYFIQHTFMFYQHSSLIHLKTVYLHKQQETSWNQLCDQVLYYSRSIEISGSIFLPLH